MVCEAQIDMMIRRISSQHLHTRYVLRFIADAKEDFQQVGAQPLPIYTRPTYKAALGKSTVHKILRQVCSTISNHFRHLIPWSVGWRLIWIASVFQSKQCFPNCIGVIDGLYIYIAAPSNTIVATTATDKNHFLSCYRVLWIKNVTSHPSTLVSHDPYIIVHTSNARNSTARWKRE